MYLNNEETATLVNVKLTSKGREYLARGFKTDNIFDLVKFSFGDSEIDYASSSPLSGMVFEPSNESVDLKYKVYSSGLVPSGSPIVSLSQNSITMSKYQTGISVSVTTQWPPVEGNYVESYKWTNLGPLNDYDFNIVKSNDTRAAVFTTQDVVGTTRVKIEGTTSGKYAILTVNII